MKRAWQLILKVLGAWAIWWVFALLGLIHPIVGPIAALFGARGRRYCSLLFNLDDRAGAVLVGYAGNKTLSWECGNSTSRFCRYLCAAASFILREQQHCQQAVQGVSAFDASQPSPGDGAQP